MPQWRKVALRTIPGRRAMIREAQSIGELWVDLSCELELVCEKRADPELARGVCAFAGWCVIQEDEDVQQTTVMHFYHALPSMDPRVWRQVAKFIPQDELDGMRDIFRCCHSETEASEFEAVMRAESSLKK